MIKAKIIKDSISPKIQRIVTYELEYPRVILAELNTHRMFSRNSASSRAIPLDKMIELIDKDPYYPIWTVNQPGMSGNKITDKDYIKILNAKWDLARKQAIENVIFLQKMKIHKQNANRLLEPFMNVKTVITTGMNGLNNFFHLRINPAAMPEICNLAKKMRDELQKSEPVKMAYGQWHLPYIDYEIDWNDAAMVEKAKQISVSCCAQVSYRKLDTTEEKALAIYQKLVSGDIIHGSAFEHICRPELPCERHLGNIYGWHQLRADIDVNR